MNKLQTISTVLFAFALTVLPMAAIAVAMYHGLQTTSMVLASI
jgi:hypothetical protein